MPQRIQDAQVIMAYAIQQASRINTSVYQMRYPDIRYRGVVPVDTTGPEYVASITYFSMDDVGAADWIHAASDDVPKVELTRGTASTTVQDAGIGYGWNTSELGQAQLLGIDLSNAKARAARRKAEEMVDDVAFYGSAEKGLNGVVNSPDVTVVDAAATGTGSSTEWEDKTPGQILADVNGILTGTFVGTNYTGLADTLLLPYTKMHDIGTRQMSENSETTLLAWLKTNNVYTMETGQPLTIRSLRGLDTAGAAGEARAVAYRNSPEVVVLHMPMPFRFFPVWQTGPFKYDVPGMMRLGGVEFMLPREAAYLDGI